MANDLRSLSGLVFRCGACRGWQAAKPNRCGLVIVTVARMRNQNRNDVDTGTDGEKAGVITQKKRGESGRFDG